ncbi:MAG: hypothetical protein U1E45_19470 [Geminicoccaceae bacterium]
MGVPARLVLGGVVLLAAGGVALADQAPSAPAQVTVSVFGPTEPTNAPGQSLYLVRYEIPAHTPLKPHHHEGTQIGLVESGTLTYHVLTGDVPVYGPGPDGKATLLKTLKAGDVATVGAGQWVVETPDDHHFGVNEGTEPLVIYTSSLLATGAPLATVDPQ